MFLKVRLAIVIVEPSAIDRQLGNDRSWKIGARGRGKIADFKFEISNLKFEIPLLSPIVLSKIMPVTMASGFNGEDRSNYKFCESYHNLNLDAQEKRKREHDCRSTATR